MSKFYLSTLLAAALLAFGGGDVQAQTDVTSQYIKNADFEGTYENTNNSNVSSNRAIYQPEGWTVEYTKGNSNDLTALTLSDLQASTVFISSKKEVITIPSTGYGEKTYRVRLFPTGKGNVKLSQTVNLPAGIYTFSASIAGIYSAKIKVFAGDKSGNEDTKKAGTFSESTVTFYVNKESDVNVGVNVTASGSKDDNKAVAYIDNCKLTYTPFSYSNQSEDLLTNGSFNSTKGWTFTDMKQNTDKKSRDTFFYEKWVKSPSTLSDVTASATQTVSNLPAGVYVLKGTVNAQLQSNSDTEITGVTLDINGQSVKCSGSWKDYEIVYNLETAGDITVTFKSEKSNANWVAVDEFSLKYAGTDYTQVVADKNKSDYESALAEAKSAQGNTSYTNVVGSEKSSLDNAITEYGADRTISDYPAATSALTSATETFIKAKDAYDELVSVQKLLPAELPYADATKVSNAKTAAENKATSADDAKTKLATIRAAVESNGIAEGISGATEILTYDFKDKAVDSKNKKVGDWTYDQTGGDLSVNSNEPWTNSNGNNTHSYFNYYNSNDDNQFIQYPISLAAGKYILTVKSRAQNTVNSYIAAIGTGKSNNDLDEINSTGGIFGNGWNDYTLEFDTEAKTVTLKCGCTQKTSGKGGWNSFGDVRLYRIGDFDALTLSDNSTYAPSASLSKVTMSRSFAKGWNTLVVPFDLTNAEVVAAFGEGAKIATFANTEGNTISFTESTTDGVTANIPVLVYVPAAISSVDFGNKSVQTGGAGTVAGTNWSLVGNYAAEFSLSDGDYMLSGDKWWKNNSYKLNAFRAYLKYTGSSADAAKSFKLVINGQGVSTVINGINAESVDDGNVYNVAGQRVSSSYKGLVIKNGKKYIK